MRVVKLDIAGEKSMGPPLVLASTSPHRRKILQDLGIAHVAVRPPFVEDPTVWAGRPVADMVVAFAVGKAESVAADHPGALVVGSDQSVELDGRALGKPGTAAAAVEQLLALAGRTHRLLTAVALHDTRRKTTTHALVTHRMTMRPLTRKQVEAYVARDHTEDCAGAYRVEGAGVLLFEAMEGPDHLAIVGLPVMALASLLAQAGDSLLERSCPSVLHCS